MNKPKDDTIYTYTGDTMPMCPKCSGRSEILGLDEDDHNKQILECKACDFVYYAEWEPEETEVDMEGIIPVSEWEDSDLLEYETRAYVVNTQMVGKISKDWAEVDDDVFIAEAERQGYVYTLSAYEFMMNKARTVGHTLVRFFHVKQL